MKNHYYVDTVQGIPLCLAVAAESEDEATDKAETAELTWRWLKDYIERYHSDNLDEVWNDVLDTEIDETEKLDGHLSRVDVE